MDNLSFSDLRVILQTKTSRLLSQLTDLIFSLPQTLQDKFTKFSCYVTVRRTTQNADQIILVYSVILHVCFNFCKYS